MLRQSVFVAASICFATCASAASLNLGSLPTMGAVSAPGANGLTALPAVGDVLTGVGVYDVALPIGRSILGNLTQPLLGTLDGALVGLGVSPALTLVTDTVGSVTDPLLGTLGDGTLSGLSP